MVEILIDGTPCYPTYPFSKQTDYRIYHHRHMILLHRKLRYITSILPYIPQHLALSGWEQGKAEDAHIPKDCQALQIDSRTRLFGAIHGLPQPLVGSFMHVVICTLKKRDIIVSGQDRFVLPPSAEKDKQSTSAQHPVFFLGRRRLHSPKNGLIIVSDLTYQNWPSTWSL